MGENNKDLFLVCCFVQLLRLRPKVCTLTLFQLFSNKSFLITYRAKKLFKNCLCPNIYNIYKSCTVDREILSVKHFQFGNSPGPKPSMQLYRFCLFLVSLKQCFSIIFCHLVFFLKVCTHATPGPGSCRVFQPVCNFSCLHVLK